ncbi:hypothetical protein KKC91_09540 [bacterium]|nr:hypothetical protein [bacterium]
MIKDKYTKATIYLDENIHKALKMRAVMLKTSISNLANNAIKESIYVKKNPSLCSGSFHKRETITVPHKNNHFISSISPQLGQCK